MRRENSIYLSIKVRPRSPKRGIKKINSSEYKVRVQAPPSKGEANRELVDILASYFDLPSSRVKIVKGEKSRHKLVLLKVDEASISTFKNK